MSQNEQPLLEDILSGNTTDAPRELEKEKDISTTLTPESILEEINRSNDPVNVNIPDEQTTNNQHLNHDQLVDDPPEAIKSEPPDTNNASKTGSLQDETKPHLDEENEKKTTDDTATLLSILANIDHIERKVTDISNLSTKTADEIREVHKLYHNEFASRLKSMQDELERYREIDKGRAFDDILREIAKLYSDHESLLETISDPKDKKKIGYMFMDIAQILELFGIHLQKSNLGDKRNTRYCQIVERIATSNPELHDTVAKSHGTGFYIENRVLIKELIDIYLYTEQSGEHSD